MVYSSGSGALLAAIARLRGFADGQTRSAARGPGSIGRTRSQMHVCAPRKVSARRQSEELAIFRILKRLWIPLVLVMVGVAGGFTVSRLHGVFGSQSRPTYTSAEREEKRPHDPKHLVYEVFGPPGTVATISYFDADAEPQLVKDATLPWSVEFPISEATAMGNVTAQGNTDSIGCRILVGDEVKDEKVRQGVSAFTFCVLKAA